MVMTRAQILAAGGRALEQTSDGEKERREREEREREREKQGCQVGCFVAALLALWGYMACL